MKDIFVTRKGLQILEARRLELMGKLKAIQRQKGPAVEEGTWHDNFSFEQLIRDENAVSKQLRDIRETIDATTIVPDVPLGTETLQIGHVVHLCIESDNVVKTVVVGGFGETDLNVKPPIIDYCAPLLKPFYGHEEGHEATVQLGGVSKNVVLESIEMRRN
jgi:transcription elongation GreA/GreB family factor